MKLKKVLSIVGISAIMAVVLAVNIACGILADQINTWVVGVDVQVDKDTLTNTAQGNKELAEQVVREGSVLVQNNDDVIPLDKDVDTKVNVFGWASTAWVIGGSGSGQVKNADGITYKADTDFLQALEDYGIEYNTELTDMYRDFKSERDYAGSGSLHSSAAQFTRLFEPSISDTNYYSDEILANAENFSDTAIVVLGRTGGESNDEPRIQYKQTEKNGSIDQDDSRTYLQISTEEEELLSFVGANYDKVVVLINSTNAMQLDFLETIDGLDACFVVGGTGVDGASAIPELLYGEIAPSGRLSDTYPYDHASNPSFAISGEAGSGAYTNGRGLYPYDGTTCGNFASPQPYTQISYMDYVEGIYVGYRYYETADAEGYFDDVDNEYGQGYDGVVQYPFGYGLSTTTFSHEIMNVSVPENTALTADSEITISVNVKNTGDIPGMEVVQLYYTPEYYAGGIEKSAINLADFAKTSLLQPGEEAGITLTIKARDMASYDYDDANQNNHEGYELEHGSYQLKLMSNSHEALTLSTESGVGYNNPTLNYTVAEDIFYDTDEYSGNEIYNHFTGSSAEDGISIDGSGTDQDINYMSRVDFPETFPYERPEDRAMPDNVKELNLFTSEQANAWVSDNSDVEMPTTSSGGDVEIWDSSANTYTAESEILAQPENFDDPLWDTVLDQVSISEMRNLTLHGYTKTAAIASIGKPATRDLDGPNQVGSFASTNNVTTGFPMETVVAQTFNKQLAFEVGTGLGRDANNNGIKGLYGPAANIHRSEYCGRNYEYYSEDPYLSGIMAANTIKGLKNAGVFCYMKHFVLYEAESNRDGMYTWLTEQALREIYLEPFHIAINEGGLTGLMSSYGRVGAVWSGGSSALLTGLLRDEWDFKGAVITDYSDHHQYMDGDLMIVAGGDLFMDGWADNGSYDYFGNNPAPFVDKLRLATKHIVYMFLNAEYTRLHPVESSVIQETYITTPRFPWWIPVLVAVDVIAVGGCGFWAFTLIKGDKKKKQAEEAEQTQN